MYGIGWVVANEYQTNEKLVQFSALKKKARHRLKNALSLFLSHLYLLFV